MTAVLPSRPVGRPKTETKLETPDDVTRMPVRISRKVWERLREYCLIEQRRPIEVIVGEWVEERMRHVDKLKSDKGKRP